MALIIGSDRKILQAIAALDARLGAIVSAQDDIDAQVTAINAAVTSLNADVTSINNEIAALKQANPGVDTTALDAAVASLTSTVGSVTAIAPPPAA